MCSGMLRCVLGCWGVLRDAGGCSGMRRCVLGYLGALRDVEVCSGMLLSQHL